jgi:hypothetical protein
VTLNTSNIAQNGIDFTDNSVIPITGVALYQGTVCPLSGATIYLTEAPRRRAYPQTTTANIPGGGARHSLRGLALLQRPSHEP